MQKPIILDKNIDRYLEKFIRYNEMIENFLMSEFLREKHSCNFDEFIVDGKFKNDAAELEFLDLSSKSSEHSIFIHKVFERPFWFNCFQF